MKIYVDKPLRVAFRDQVGVLFKRINATQVPNKEECVHICKMYGILTESVEEVNELEETPLMTVCTEPPTENKLKLLIKAGADVNARTSYPGILRKGK